MKQKLIILLVYVAVFILVTSINYVAGIVEERQIQKKKNIERAPAEEEKDE